MGTGGRRANKRLEGLNSLSIKDFWIGLWELIYEKQIPSTGGTHLDTKLTKPSSVISPRFYFIVMICFIYFIHKTDV
jgi:hypothetical protein